MSGGGSTGSVDSRFERKGTVDSSSWRNLGTNDRSRFHQSLKKVDDWDSVKRNTTKSLNQHTNRGWGDVPYSDAFCDVVKDNLPGNAIPGQQSLQAQAGVNPYSDSYANNTFNRYSDEVQKVMGQARSGPAATMGGTAAQGYAQSDAVNQLALNREDVLAGNRRADASIQQGASAQLGQQEGRMDSTALQGATAGQGGFFSLLNDQTNASRLVTDRAKIYSDIVPTFATLGSKMMGTENNDLSGRNAQTNSSFGLGANLCCFIFLESYNGVLPDSVRRYRDLAAPENSARRAGYIRMSKWLVPAMRVSESIRTLANHLLVKPLTSYGEWYYGKNKFGWVFWPLKQGWFKFWELTGR